MVAWESFGQTAGASYDVMMRCYDEFGAAAGVEQIANEYKTDKQQTPAVAAFPDGSGKYVVVWQSYGEDGADWGVYGQVYFQDCFKIGTPFAIHSTKVGEQSQPRVAVDKDGNFTVLWRSAGQDGSSFGIYGQSFDKNAAKVGGEFKVNSVTANEQSRPVLGYRPDGTFVSVWQTIGEDEDGFGLKQALRDGKGQLGLDFLGNTTFKANQSLPAVGVRPNGSWVVVWGSAAQDGDKGAVVGRVFK